MTDRHDLDSFVMQPGAQVADVLKQLDRNGEGILIVLDDGGRVEATITDGDIRRALLAGVSLDAPAREVIEMGKTSVGAKGPVVALEGTDDAELLRIMTEGVLFQIPLVDETGRLVDISFLHEVAEPHEPPQAVVMAGGFGRRIMPLTEAMPKPMLQVGDRPLMERTIERLRDAGIKRVNISVHYLPEKIREYFGSGERFDIDLHYVTEDEPLGTAGSLRFLRGSEEPLLVVNGDIATNLDFRSFVSYHKQHGAELTLAVHRHSLPVPYGLVECEGPYITALKEKPSMELLVNAGLYLMQPSVLDAIPASGPVDMPHLVERLLAEKRPLAAFFVHEYWQDIGSRADYESAQEHFGNVNTE